MPGDPADRDRWRVGWSVVAGTVSWHGFDDLDAALAYHHAVVLARSSAHPEVPKRSWLAYRATAGEPWVLMLGEPPVPRDVADA